MKKSNELLNREVREVTRRKKKLWYQTLFLEQGKPYKNFAFFAVSLVFLPSRFFASLRVLRG